MRWTGDKGLGGSRENQTVSESAGLPRRSLMTLLLQCICVCCRIQISRGSQSRVRQDEDMGYVSIRYPISNVEMNGAYHVDTVVVQYHNNVKSETRSRDSGKIPRKTKNRSLPCPCLLWHFGVNTFPFFCVLPKSLCISRKPGVPVKNE